MLDTYLMLEPNVSCNHILKTQLLLPLLQNLHNPGLYEVFLNLIEPFTSKYDIFGQLHVYFWRQCLETGYFDKLTDLIIKESPENLNSPTSEDETKEIMLLLDNAEKHYSKQKTQMIQIEMVKRMGGISNFLRTLNDTSNQANSDARIPDSLETILGPSSYSLDENSKENLSMGEFQGKAPDIDGLLVFSQRKKKPMLMKLPSIEYRSKTAAIPSLPRKDPEKMASTITTMRASADKLRATSSSLDMDKGFTSSKLISLYPTRFLVEHRAKLDYLASKSDYQLINLKESEKSAFPASSLLYNVIGTVMEYEENIDKVKFLKIKRIEGVGALPMIFMRGVGKNFEKILINYLVKINSLTKYNEYSNSAKDCGKLVNFILKRLINSKSPSYPLISKYKATITRSCRMCFDYLCKMLMMVKNLKMTDFHPDNYEIPSPLVRSMLIETLCYMCKATVGDKFCLINEINATLWHVLILNFFANRSNDIFESIFVQLIELAVNFGTEETLFNLLFKVNMLGSLYNAYETFVRNEVADKSLNIDSFLFYCKRIVEHICLIYKKKNDFKEVKAYLKASKNWNKLKNEFNQSANLEPKIPVLASNSKATMPRGSKMFINKGDEKESNKLSPTGYKKSVMNVKL